MLPLGDIHQKEIRYRKQRTCDVDDALTPLDRVTTLNLILTGTREVYSVNAAKREMR
jgi:hypothetical protein